MMDKARIKKSSSNHNLDENSTELLFLTYNQEDYLFHYPPTTRQYLLQLCIISPIK